MQNILSELKNMKAGDFKKLSTNEYWLKTEVGWIDCNGAFVPDPRFELIKACAMGLLGRYGSEHPEKVANQVVLAADAILARLEVGE